MLSPVKPCYMQGRRVLIFSQFVIMLNVLEDYCHAVGFPVERIDGNVKSRDRQQAIDRFSAGAGRARWGSTGLSFACTHVVCYNPIRTEDGWVRRVHVKAGLPS